MKNNLPYFNSFKINNGIKEKKLAQYFLKKFKPRIKEKIPSHYLVCQRPDKNISFIKTFSKKYPYFLRFDILKYYPSINHKILNCKISEVYHKLSQKNISRRMKKELKELPLFLNYSPYNKGIPTGSSFSYALSGIFLLDLDLNIPVPFLRQTDDYLLFLKTKKDAEKIMKNIIIPKLNELGLEINEKKLLSGKFHSDKVDFIGFDFYSGYFTIKESKKEEFKKRIITITHLTRKKSEKAIIKLLNNQILGFGHYYKHSSCKKDFQELDSFIRMRLRRYLAKNKDSKDKSSNLLLNNKIIENIGLKSLLKIKNKYDSKKRPISLKKRKKKLKNDKEKFFSPLNELAQTSHFYEQKFVLEELRKITNLLNKLEKKTTKIAKKMKD